MPDEEEEEGEEEAESRSDWWWARRKRTRSGPLLSASTRSETEARADHRRGQCVSARISTRKAYAQTSRKVTLKSSVVVVVVAVAEMQFVRVWRSMPVVERSVRAE